MPQTFAEWISFISACFTILGVTGVATWGLVSQRYAVTATRIIVTITRATVCMVALLICTWIGFYFANSIYETVYSILNVTGDMLTDGNYRPNRTAIDIITATPAILLGSILYAASCVLIFRGWEPLKEIVLILLHRRPLPDPDAPSPGDE